MTDIVKRAAVNADGAENRVRTAGNCGNGLLNALWIFESLIKKLDLLKDTRCIRSAESLCVYADNILGGFAGMRCDHFTGHIQDFDGKTTGRGNGIGKQVAGVG